MTRYVEMKKKVGLIAGTLVVAMSLTGLPQAQAQEVDSKTVNCGDSMNAPQPEVGSQEFTNLCSKQLLDIQRSGSHASDHPQTLPALVLDEVIERYENSFTHPVPEFFSSNEFGSDEQ